MRVAVLLVAALALPLACREGTEAPKGPKAPTSPGLKAAGPPALQIAAWLGSEPLSLGTLKGKVVVLDFWNTTCAPCRTLMPHLAELYTKHKAEGLVVIGVTEDEKADLDEFLKKIPVAYPIAMDQLKGGEGQTFDAYKIGAIPTVCLIARDGSLVWKGAGDKLTDAMVLAELAKK